MESNQEHAQSEKNTKKTPSNSILESTLWDCETWEEALWPNGAGSINGWLFSKQPGKTAEIVAFQGYLLD